MPEVKRSKSSSAHAPAVSDVLRVLNDWIPFDLAADWDNVGLLLGRPDWPARRTMLTIDLTDEVAREALVKRVQLIVAYHPPVFRPTRSLTPLTPGPTGRLPDLLAARTSIIALHTALDAAVGGTNDVLLDLFDTTDRRPLEPIVRSDRLYKLVVFVPPTEADRLRQALSAAGAGLIGHYSECSFELRGRGTFRGDETTRPTIGRKLELEHVDEVRLEMIVPRACLGAVVRSLYATHSYEEPAFDLYPLHETPGRAAIGLGRVGRLRRPTVGTALLRQLERGVDLSAAMVIGKLERRFTSVTAAAGAFGVEHLRDPESLVLIGECKHHEALELRRRGLTALQLGHYASERPVLEAVRSRLRQAFPGLEVLIARSAGSPISPLRSLIPRRR